MAFTLSLPARRAVLADVVPGARPRDVAVVMGTAVLTAMLAEVVVPVSGSPVPLTGQTRAVVLTGSHTT
jgi:biotin transport system substrate-specific component